MNIKIITPPVATSDRDLDLVKLTEYIFKKVSPDEQYDYGLGGEFGYGENYENDVFMMHRYCWCESEDCAWCGGCTCPEGTSHYYVDGLEVSFDEWMEFFQKQTAPPLDYTKPVSDEQRAEWLARAEAANLRRDELLDHECDYCLSKGAFSGWPSGMGAPNFYHKESGLMVWWYKWIGRDMNWNKSVSDAEWRAIFDACVKSL